MQQTILLFGAGKSATALIQYLADEAVANNWQIIIADADKKQLLSKIPAAPFIKAVEIDISNNKQRAALIKQASIVISLMPPSLHFLIAKDCVAYAKNLLTASYVDESVKSLQAAIETKGLLFIFEMGLDPGIDHMSAMEIIDSIHIKGGTVLSFKSYCGGLVAPENDNNPWRYKISWNPKNVVLAGKAGAIYKLDKHIVKEEYQQLFKSNRGIEIKDLGFLSYYPNRDSMGYIDLYQLKEANTFMRATLRYPDFIYGWKNIIELKLTDETKAYETNGLSLCDFYKQHFKKHGLEDWLQQNITTHFTQTKVLLDSLLRLKETEEQATAEGIQIPDNFMLVGEKGELESIDVDAIKSTAASTLAGQMHEANLTLKQLFYLGMDDTETFINKGLCSAADVLQFALETNLVLQPDDKDMVVMLHEFIFLQQNKEQHLKSSMIVKGENNINTAMAKTVGLPLGIAAKLILNNTIQLTGLHIPVKKEIYKPVLEELKKFGIEFVQTSKH